MSSDKLIAIMYQQLKNLAFAALEGDDSKASTRLYRVTNGIIVSLILLSVVTLTLETVKSLHDPFLPLFIAVELISVFVFTIEYIARIWIAPMHPSGKYDHPVWGRFKYALSPMAIIDLAAILPFYLIFFFPFVDLRFLRLIRMLRMLKIMRYSPALNLIGQAFRAEKRSWTAAGIVIVVLVFFAATGMWIIEHSAQPDEFSSIPASMWWAVVTLTTVGYGDIVPITPLGKVFGSVITVMGIIMFTLPAAIFASGFLRELKRQDFVVNFKMVSSVPILSGLDTEVLSDIASALRPWTVPQRYTILRRHETPDAVYFIIDGRVEIDTIQEQMIFGAGEFFGHFNPYDHIDSSHRTSVTAITDCQLLVLSIEDLQDLMAKWPSLRKRIDRVEVFSDNKPDVQEESDEVSDK
jgi:voltage-gated potassium channel